MADLTDESAVEFEDGATDNEASGDKEAGKGDSPKPDADISPPLISVGKGNKILCIL